MPATEVAATGAAKGGKRPPQSWLLFCSCQLLQLHLAAEPHQRYCFLLLDGFLDCIITINILPYDSALAQKGVESTSTYHGLKGGAVAHKVCEWVMTPCP